VVPGRGGGFSLEAPLGVRFLIRSWLLTGGALSELETLETWVWCRRPVSSPGPAAQIRPILLAAYTASARRVAPSFFITLPTWNFTVVAEMYSRCPIALLLSPRASRARISRSRA
jgi:hypothetical protein